MALQPYNVLNLTFNILHIPLLQLIGSLLPDISLSKISLLLPVQICLLTWPSQLVEKPCHHESDQQILNAPYRFAGVHLARLGNTYMLG